jgi:hypothetical protein
MRKIVWLAVLAIPLIVLATLPARVVLSFLELPEGIGQIQGSVWSGQAHWRQPGHTPMRIDWRWRGGSRWHWQAEGADTRLQGRWQPTASGLALSGVEGQLALDRVDLTHWLINARPRGHLEVALERAVIAPGQVPEIAGQMTWREARLEGAIHESLGEIGMAFSHRDGAQLVRVESLRPASIQVRGRIDLGASHYEVDLWMRASSDRPELVSQLARLGEMQPDGQVRMQLRGMLGW